MSTTVQYKGNTLATVSNDTKTLKTAGKYMEGDVSITDNSGSGQGNVWQDAEGYLHLDDESEILLQTKNATPSETAQTIKPDAGYYALDKVNVSAISSTYVGSGITRRSSSDLTASGATVSVPSGYYASNTSKAVSSGSATTPATTVTANPSISVNSSGLITATASATKSVTPTVSAGYVSSGTAGTITVSGSNTSQLSTQAGKTVTPTESEQIAVASGKYTIGAIKVGAISSTYVGSGITQRDSDDLIISGATVTAPSGYYSASASKSVASMTLPTAAATSATSGYTKKATIGRSTSTQYINIGTGYNSAGGYYEISAVANGTAGTPTATKGTVSNHSVSITPSVTNTTGYITGGTKSGTAVSVSASELVSGNKSITANGTNIDVANYSTVSVAIESATGDYMAKATKSGTFTFTIQIGSGSRTNITDGAKYFFNSGDTIKVRVVDGGSVYYNGTLVASNGQSTVSYSFTAPSNHLNIACSSDRIDINVTLVPSGTKTITENGTGIDVTNYASVDVDVPSSGGSSYTFIASTEYTVSTSSTTSIELESFDTGDTSIWTSDKMVYVKIRDKAGRRNGYYYGSDSFIINLIKGNGLTATSSYQIAGSSFYQNAGGYLQQAELYRGSSSASVTGYGIYPTFIYNDGRISLNARYSTSSFSTGTIDGTFSIEVYLLDFPNGISPFNG